MRAALESFAPCSSPAGVDEIAERRHSHWLDRKAGKARCSAATKFTGQDGLAKARRVSRTPSSGTRHSLSSLRQQDSLLPSARVHCPASKGLSALSQPFGDLLPPRVSFGAKASSCFPLGTGTCAHSVGVGLCQRKSALLFPGQLQAESIKSQTQHTGACSVPHLYPTQTSSCHLLCDFVHHGSCRRRQACCLRTRALQAQGEPHPHVSVPLPRPAPTSRSRVYEHVLTLFSDWIGDAGQRPRRSSS